MLYLKKIRASLYLYWQKEEFDEPISIGHVDEVFDVLDFIQKSKYKNKKVVADTLKLVNRENLSWFLMQSVKTIKEEVVIYEERYG